MRVHIYIYIHKLLLDVESLRKDIACSAISAGTSTSSSLASLGARGAHESHGQNLLIRGL